MEQPAPTQRPRFAPVRGQERIGSVDVLRGVALCGILGMNIYAFALPWPAYANPLKWGGTGTLDIGTWWFTHLFFEMKFMTIFSMLFGAGLALMAERAEARGIAFGWIYYRRLFWLLLIGAVHGYLLWYGDILFMYAVCGLMLFPLRRFRPRSLIPAGIVLMLVTVPLGLGFGMFVLPEIQDEAQRALVAQQDGEELTDDQQAAIDFWEAFDPGAEELDKEIEVYRNGYLSQIVFRAPLVFQFQTVFLLLFGIWRVGGLMLVGMGLMKLGVFAARRSTRFYLLCCVIGYGVGIPVTYYGALGLTRAQFGVLYVNQGGYLPNYFGSLFIAMGHVGVVMLVCKSGAVETLAARFAAVGRMALTNYLMHTVLCTTLFYGWGFGLFGHVNRLALMGIVAAVWLLQLAVSQPWLERFRFGPAEWVWRSLTYWKRQPMRID